MGGPSRYAGNVRSLLGVRSHEVEYGRASGKRCDSGPGPPAQFETGIGAPERRTLPNRNA